MRQELCICVKENNKMRKEKIMSFIVSAFVSSIFVQAQSVTPNVKEGTFYSYPRNATEQIIITRAGNIQTEIYDGKDSIIWQLKWLSDAVYSLKYLRGGETLDKKTVTILKKHSIVYSIDQVTEAYYIFQATIDKEKGIPFQTDTIWFAPKLARPDTRNFALLPDQSFLRKSHFSDTSSYSIVYLYRPRKSLFYTSDFPVYFDGNVFTVIKNGTGYILKIFQPGIHTFKISAAKHQDTLSINTRPGKRYYIKCSLRLALSNILGEKPQLLEMKKEEGEIDFYGVTVQLK